MSLFLNKGPNGVKIQKNENKKKVNKSFNNFHMVIKYSNEDKNNKYS